MFCRSCATPSQQRSDGCCSGCDRELAAPTPIVYTPAFLTLIEESAYLLLSPFSKDMHVRLILSLISDDEDVC
eukprot:3881440-Pleurochrysis_carterae.AAC.1